MPNTKCFQAADAASALTPFQPALCASLVSRAWERGKGVRAGKRFAAEPVWEHLGRSRPMRHWQSGDVEANGIRLHYTRTGGARPPLVLAHGVTDDGLCWTPVAEALAPDYDVIMVDARGHGRSDALETGYDPATQAADLACVIAALGLHKPAVLGHSMGAATTLVLAGMYSNLPGAILLEDPPGWWVAAPEPASAEQAGKRVTSSTIYGRERADEERLVG